MLYSLLTAIIAATPQEGVEERLATLERHYDCLLAIETSPPHLGARQERLRELRQRLDEGTRTHAGVNELYRAMDAVREWLWAHAAKRPARAPGEFTESDTAWNVAGPDLNLRVARHNLAITVTTPAAEWSFAPSDASDLSYAGKGLALTDAARQEAEPFNPGYAPGMRLTFAEFPGADGLILRITVYVIGNEVVFDIAAEEEGARFGGMRWPKPIETPASPDALTVCPVMQGALIPGDWHQEIRYAGLTNSREFYMPWWGHIAGGHGVLAILETSDDAGGYCAHPAGGPTRIGPRWYPSLGAFRTMRTIRYVFQDEASYVSLAKRYRRHAQEGGRFVSLREKVARTPALNDIIGSPVVHIGALYHYVPEAAQYNKDREEANHQLRTFDELAESLSRLAGAGIGRAYVHLDGWGFYGYDSAHPDPLPVGYEQGGWDGLRRFSETCEELGYFFAVHDQYRDLYLNSPAFDERVAVTDLAGERFEMSHWCGGPQTVLSPRYAKEHVRRNHDRFKEQGVNVRGAYLDVFSVVPLEESAQPGCPVTRSDCARYREECFDLLRARGYVVSSEEPTDYLMDAIDLVHHAPYPMYPHIWSGGEQYAIPVPLFNLVYHDALITPWDLHAGGWGIPAGTSGYLHCLLNAGAPYASAPYGSVELREENIEKVKRAAALAERCAFAEMTNHEFLNESRTKQRATFSNGTQVTVDFATGETQITPPLR